MRAHLPVQAHFSFISACAHPISSCRPIRPRVLLTVVWLAGLLFIGIGPANAQVKQVTPLLELARQSAMELQALPVADPRAGLLLTGGLEQLQHAQQLAEIHIDQLGAAQGPLSRADRNLTRLQLARIAYLRGELYRLTATKRTLDDPTRQAYLDSAVLIFTDMRQTFRSIEDAKLARVGLARCYRLLGQLEQAAKILKPILRLRNLNGEPPSENQLNLWRAAIVEKLEITLLQAPEMALTQARTWQTHSRFVEQANWVRSLKRIEALAAVQLALKNPTPNPVNLAVAQLADSSLPPAVQLRYLMQLELASNLPIISPQQRNDWVLLVVDRLPAQEAVDRITRQIPNPRMLNAQAVMAYGSALWQIGELGRAVNSFSQAMRLTDSSNPLHGTASYWHAQCLYQQAINTSRADLPKRAKDALSQLVQTHRGQAIRLTALKQWVNLTYADQGLAAAVAIITQYPTLGSKDPYLTYLLLADQWAKLQQAVRQKTLPANTAHKQASQLLRDAQAAVTTAKATGDLPIAGGLMQLQARVEASSFFANVTAALALLDESQTLLKQPQGQLKVLLLIENNKLEKLWELLANSQNIALDSKTWVMLIKAFAQQASLNADDVQLTERTNELVIRAWNRDLSDEDRIHIAQTMVLLRSWDVCLTLLGREPIQSNSPQLNLVIGQALLGENRDLDQAINVLKQVTADLPNSSQAHLWLAMAYAGDDQHRQAAEHYRKVRQLEKPATLTWWQATLGLAQSLKALGQTQAARQILQVTLTLYPVIGDDALKQDLNKLLGRLQKS